MKKQLAVGAVLVGAAFYLATYWGLGYDHEKIQDPTQAPRQATTSANGEQEGNGTNGHFERSSRPGSGSTNAAPAAGTGTGPTGSRPGSDSTSGGVHSVASQEEQNGMENRLPSRSGNVTRHIAAGTFTITAYTAGYESTQKHPGDPGYGITATGTKVAQGRTIAADWDVLPPGTIVYIEGLGERIVEDKGAAVQGTHIDVYFERLDDALEWGRQKRQVWIVKKRGETK